MADKRSKLHQLLKEKQLNSALYEVCTDVLQDFTAVMKESGTKRETANITITASKTQHCRRSLKFTVAISSLH
jgi:hypothetical protein